MVAGIRRIIGQIQTASIPTSSITFAQTKVLTQSAVATLPPAKAYVTFTTPYGSVPDVTMDMLGSYRPSKGTLSFDIARVRPGSFQWIGTPSLRFRWLAQGM